MIWRRWARPLAAALAVSGVVVLGWVGATLFWGEPLSARAAERAQRALRTELTAIETASELQQPMSVRAAAAAFRARLRPGDAVGELVIARLGLRAVVVEGTTSAALARGPGRYRITSFPGLGGTVAVAGHRTTYLQPFRHLDELGPGDEVTFRLPYGTFDYAVTGRRIVDDQDWSIIRPRGFDQLVLSACHPLWSAEQRIVVFARLERATSQA